MCSTLMSRDRLDDSEHSGAVALNSTVTVELDPGESVVDVDPELMVNVPHNQDPFVTVMSVTTKS
jgi:hypothetical protein